MSQINISQLSNVVFVAFLAEGRFVLQKWQEFDLLIIGTWLAKAYYDLKLD